MTTPLDTRIPPVAWTLGLAVAQWAIAGRPDPRRRPGPARLVCAGAVGAASTAVGVAALREFFRRGTTVHPGQPGHASVLVGHGIYRHTRNPMYLALTGSLVAHAAWLGSVRALVPVAALSSALTAFQIVPEERALRERFGPEFADYCRQVPRWLGPRRPGPQDRPAAAV